MIKFFRKIRQKMLSENKFSKYFIYAIGEIVLVVIGILIALSINSWYDNVKKKEQEIVYYCKVKEDLEADRNNILKSIESLDERLVSAKRVLMNLYKGTNDKATILKDYFPSIRSYDFVPSKLAIQDITSSGKLENLKNSELKRIILQHYADMEFALSNISENEKGSDQYIYAYDDLVDFGLHQTPAYTHEFGKELLNQMPNVNWLMDEKNVIYKQFQEHMTLSVVVSAREKQLLNQILESNNNLRFKLEKYCD
jgi:Family of unknown function (DUF6090)